MLLRAQPTRGLNSMDAYEPLLPGIGFAGYRSFATWQSFEFPTKVTVLAGINNSGKSNVLRFLQAALPKIGNTSTSTPDALQLSDLDRPRGFAHASAFTVGMPIRVGSV